MVPHRKRVRRSDILFDDPDFLRGHGGVPVQATQKTTEHARHTGDQQGEKARSVSSESPHSHLMSMTPEDRAFRHRNFTSRSFLIDFFVKARICLRSFPGAQCQQDLGVDCAIPSPPVHAAALRRPDRSMRTTKTKHKARSAHLEATGRG